MKKFLSSLICLLFLSLAISSCTVTRRQHQPGVYFKWNTSTISGVRTPGEKEIVAKSNAFSPIKSTTDTSKSSCVSYSLILPIDTVIPSQDGKIETFLRREEMIRKSNAIQGLHRFKQIITAAGLTTLAVGSSYIITASTVAFPIFTIGLLILAFALVTAMIALIIVSEVKRFKKQFAEFENEKEFKRALHARKQARLSLIFSYALLGLTLVFLIFAGLFLLFEGY